MPARVEYRLGSIFDEECDIIVIPSSVGGTVSPGVQEELRKAGLPFPVAMGLGTISLNTSPNPRYRKMAFAAAVRGQSTSPRAIEMIGLSLGRNARLKPARISAPLLGAGAGDLTPLQSVTALEGGFLAAQPHDESVLTINVRKPEVFAALVREYPLPARGVDAITPAGIEDENPPARDAVPSRWEVDANSIRELLTNSVDAVSARLQPSERTRVFISYSHEDAEWLQRLQKHLAPLQRDGALIWDDTRIKAGAQWREEIREALRQTRVAVLLISADFMASEFIVTNELPPLLDAAEKEGATILPVIISASSFIRTPSLSRFQAVNDPDKPLVQLRRANREKVLDDVARAVEDALKR